MSKKPYAVIEDRKEFLTKLHKSINDCCGQLNVKPTSKRGREISVAIMACMYELVHNDPCLYFGCLRGSAEELLLK